MYQPLLDQDDSQAIARRTHGTLKWLGRSAMPALIFYEGFNLISAHKSLVEFGTEIAGLHESDISAIAWFISSVTVFFETGTNLALISPDADARALTGYGAPLSAAQPHKPLFRLDAKSIASAAMMFANFGLYSLPNVYTIYYLAGNTPWSIALMVPVWTVAVAYNVMFCAKDVVESYHELDKKLVSVYALLWKKNKLQFTRCFVEGFLVFNFYYSVTMAYANAKFFDQQVGLPQLTLPSQLLGILSVAHVMLVRIERQYRVYLAPFLDENKTHDLTRITSAERETARKELDLHGKTKLYARASVYGLLLAGGVFYFAHKYSDLLLENDWHQHVVSLLISGVVGAATFAVIFKTDLTHELNTAAAEAKKLTAQSDAETEPKEEIRFSARLAATLCNLGSQSTRTICGFTFFHTLLSRVGNDSAEDALAIDLMVCLIVCPIIARYYQPKLERNFTRNFDYFGELFSNGIRRISRSEFGQAHYDALPDSTLSAK